MSYRITSPGIVRSVMMSDQPGPHEAYAEEYVHMGEYLHMGLVEPSVWIELVELGVDDRDSD